MTDSSCNRRAVSALVLAAALALSTGSAAASSGAPAGPSVKGDLPIKVLVTGEPGASLDVTTALRAAGAGNVRALSVLDGASATVRTSALSALRRAPGVRAVVPDGRAVAAKQKWGDDNTNEDEQASALTGNWRASEDNGSPFTIAEDTGVKSVWGKNAPATGERLTGKGVGVALIDTGVTPVPGLDGATKLVYGPDLSPDSQDPATANLDAYGHGTHMAGLIAGRDANVPAGGEQDAKYFVGMAPDATLVSVKVGAADGAVDVSQVIAGIDWVVQNRQEHNIRVLNLSYGTDSTQSPAIDPLAHAVGNAWRAGIVVVVAAGNGGREGATSLTMPAVDPLVLAVGSTDHQGRDDPRYALVGDWTNPGTAARRPDIVVHGKSVVSLRVPGSYADNKHPEGRVTGDQASRFFRGTGTSQSTAIVSGAVALLIQRNPSLTPDQVKALLRVSARKLRTSTNPAQGAGLLNLEHAVGLLKKNKAPTGVQKLSASTGLGSLQASRGSSALVDPIDGTVLTGEQDLFGQPWNPATWSAASFQGRAWSGGTWNGRAWSGDGWSGRAWSGRAWSGASWSGRAWSGRAWSAAMWTGRAWSAEDWSGRAWSGRAWSWTD